jgi:hypothetical protein
MTLRRSLVDEREIARVPAPEERRTVPDTER